VQDDERTPAKPRYATLRWVLFLPSGLVSGFIVADIIWFLNYIILQAVPLLIHHPDWFFDGFVPLIEHLALGGIAVAIAAKVAPSHRKVVGLCVAGGLIFLAVGMFLTNMFSGNTLLWNVSAAIGVIGGSCIGAAYAFWLSKRDLKPPAQ